VGTILEGSIRHSDGRIRVTAQLIDAQSGYHIWSKNYDREFDEVFEVQDDIALSISQSMKLTLDENSQPDSRKATTGDIEAFALYLKGRELFNDRIHLRSEGLRRALDFYSKAIQQDPGFAQAHAGIASIYWLLTSYDDSLDEEAYFELAEASANFALEIDPDTTAALAALAMVEASRGNIEQAAALFEKIRTIGSNDSNIVHWEASLHIRLGYFDELIEPLTEVYRLDPLNEHIGWSLAAALNFSGQPGKAAGILTGLEFFSYRQYVLGLTAIYRGDFEQARDLLRDVRMRSGVLPAVYADLLIDALENSALMEETAQKFVLATETGDLEKCVSFESLLILGSPRVFDLGMDPYTDITRMQIHAQVWNNWGVAIRQDPRFKEWVEALGYVDFWRKYGWPDRCRPTGADDFECV
jgi:tetratricopeptide (TPR) repeat protein